MILCNSSDRIAKQRRAEARKQWLRSVAQIITWPLRLRIKVTLATDLGQKENAVAVRGAKEKSLASL